MRASRLVSVLLLLQTRGRLNATQLATELEVSVRTIYRDIEALAAAGVPLYANTGPAGGYQLLDGYRTRLNGLTAGEAESLFLSGMPGPAAELGLGTVLAAAELKVLSALPPELRSRAGRIRERFHLDAPAWFREADQTPHLTAVAEAVWSQRPIRVQYYRWKAPRQVSRTLDPLGVVLKSGLWYLVARAGTEIRTYRVSQILELEQLDGPFERPPDFDLPEYWQAWASRYERSVYVGQAVVRLAPAAISRLHEVLPPLMAKAAQETAGPPDPDGWVRAVIPVEQPEVAHHDLIKLGADIEVLEPAELRERLAATAASLAALYRS